MSDLRIALVAEGPTDFEVIQAALKAVLAEPFVMVLLQPEATRPQLGAGWCGVVKWCREAQQRSHDQSNGDPTLVGFDLLIVHLDVDVASEQYGDCGALIENSAQASHWKSLPCVKTCPPVANTVKSLVEVIESWLGQLTSDNRLLFCLPAQSSGSWLAAAVLPSSHPLL